MAKKIANFGLKYLNNKETVIISWNTGGGILYNYRVYAADGSGKFELIDTVDNNFLMFEAGSYTKAYVEKRTSTGGYIAESQHISLKPNSSEFINITGINSYDGITMNWTENNPCSNYFVLKKVGKKYRYVFQLNIAQCKFDRTDSRVTYKVLEFGSKGQLLKMSHDFTVCPDCFKIRNDSGEVKLSVVIPVYNNEEFFSYCMDSVLASDMDGLEVIVVDDGSSDNTPAVADWYRDNYPGTVTVIHTPNQGAAEARNVGIRAAHGNYITFTDSDDVVSSSMFGELYRNALELDCDISLCRYYTLQKGNKNTSVLFHNFCLPLEENRAYSTDRLMKFTYAPKYMSVSMWNKIYRTSIVREHLVPKLKYEDAAWSPIIYSFSDTFCFADKPLYVYNRVVEDVKPTLSNEFAKMEETEMQRERTAAYRFMLENGNRSKREYLMLIGVRLVLSKFDMAGRMKFPGAPDNEISDEAARVLLDYMLEHKEEICANSLIRSDFEVMDDLKKVCEKYGIDLGL